MTSSQIFAAIDAAITGFMTIARGMLAPMAILCAFFAGIKMITVIVPFVGAFVPGMLLRGEPLQLAAVAIAYAMAAGRG